jgi:hypothetical protein
MRDIDCKPVEPEAVEQKKLKAIFKVKGHDRSGTVGTITKTKGWLSLFESTDGKFLRWCYDSEFDLLDESGKRISQSSEPEAVEQPTKRELTDAQKIAERTMKAIWATQPKPEPEPVVKESLNTESDKLNTVTFDIGDPVMSYDGRKGIVEAINLIAEFPITVRHSMREHVSYKFGGVKHDETTQAPDPVNPSHYKQGSIECIEAMKVALGGGFLGYLRGNAIKYLWKYDKKNGIEDLKKARWYLDRLIQEEESK